ncbi:MAG: hypothetical protein IKS42_04150, partial [Oscillospiraceae bacterium]|nr:hypothetical protein [Oscillospiraceae bacterium]
MKGKTFGKRFLSAAAGFVLAMGTGLPMELTVPVTAADPTAAPVFSLDHDALGYDTWDWTTMPWTQITAYMSADDLYAEIGFTDEEGNSVEITTDPNTYYLLVHAVGKDVENAKYQPDGPYGTTYYYDYIFEVGESRDGYQLIEINLDGGSNWKSEKFSVLPRKTVTASGDRWGTPVTREIQAVPDTESVEAYVIKNNDPSAALTLEDAIAENGCAKVNQIEDMNLIPSNSLTKKSSNFVYNNDTVEVQAIDGVVMNVEVYDNEGNLAPLQNDTQYNFVVLATVTDSEGKLIGWAIKPFDPKNNSKTTLGFFTINGCDADGVPTGETFKFDPETQKIDYRVYHAKTEDESLTSYADCKDGSKASDSIPCYRFEKESSGVLTTVKIIEDSVQYKISVDYDNVTLDPAKHTYIMVEVQHQTSANTYYFKELNGTDTEYVAQTGHEAYWLSLDGEQVKETHDRIGGTETITPYLVVSDNEITVANAVNHTDCRLMAIPAATVDWLATADVQNISRDEETHVTDISDKVHFTAPAEVGDYNYASVLGDAMYFGIVADEYAKLNHAQTNFAANYYEQGGFTIEPDLTPETGGSFLVGHIVGFNGEKEYNDNVTVYKAEDPGKVGLLNIGESHSGPDAVYMNPDNILNADDPDNMVALENPGRQTNNGGWVEVIPTDASEIAGRIKSMTDYMTSMSDELASYADTPSVSVYPTNKEASRYKLDTTDFPQDATIFVDGDELVRLLGTDIGQNLELEIYEGQTIVFNFVDTEYVHLTKLDNILYHYADDPDTAVPQSSMNAQKIDNAENAFLAKLTPQLIWNLNSLKEVDISTSAGVFLVKDPDSVTNGAKSGTSTGWICSAGYVENTGGEWHNVFADMVKIPEKSIFINKADMGGKQLPSSNAVTFKLIPAEGGSLVGATVAGKKLTGDTVDAENAETMAQVAEDGSYTFTGNSTKISGLADGSYTLHEEAAPNGYKAVTDFNFTIKNGKITEKVIVVENGKVEVTSGMKMVVMDEDDSAPETKKMYIEKKAVGGGEIAEGEVTFVLISETDLTGIVKVAGESAIFEEVTDDETGATTYECVFNGNSTLIEDLPAGTYTLREEAAPEGYEVISDMTFTVDDEGKITEINVATTGDAEVDATGRILTVFDAKKAGPKSITVSKQNLYTRTEIASDNPATFRLYAGYEDALIGITVAGETVTAVESETQGEKTVYYYEFTGNNTEITGLKNDNTTIYTLHEETAPNGYATASDFRFAVDTDGQLRVVDAESDGEVMMGEDGGIIVLDKRTVSISKRDLQSNAIEGEGPAAQATFRLYTDDIDSFGGLIVNGNEVPRAEFKTEGTRYFYEFRGNDTEFVGLAPDTVYTLVEQTAPKGYLTTSSFEFKIAPDGSVDTSSVKAVTDGETVSANVSGGAIVVLDEKEVPKTITISKRDLQDAQIEGEGDDAKATFHLIADAPDKLVGITVAGGTALTPEDVQRDTEHAGKFYVEFTGNDTDITGLKAGTYILQEKVAPKGYEVTSEFTFTVTEEGLVDTSTVTAITDGDVEVVKLESNKITVKDAKEEQKTITITKQGVGATTIPASNPATFKLAPVDATKNSLVGVTVKLEDGTEKTLTAENLTDGAYEFKGNATSITGLSDGDYTFEEIAAPTGYQKLKNETETGVQTVFTFTIAGGEVDTNKTVATTTGKVELTANGIVILDDISVIELDKQIASGDTAQPATSPATFTLTSQGGKTLAQAGTKIEIDGTVYELGQLSDGSSYDAAQNLLTISGVSFKFIGLPDADEYTLTETASPTGTRRITTAFTFEVADGVITTKETVTDGDGTIDSTTGKLIVTDNISDITISKKTLDANSQEASAPAEFTLTLTKADKEGATLENVKVSADGTELTDAYDAETGIITFTGADTEFKGLPDGTYELEEITSPDGFTVVTTITFRIEDGKVVNTETDKPTTKTTGGVDVDEQGNLIVTDNVSDITISKKTLDG